MVTLTGTPIVLDRMLRPFARLAQVFLGLVPSAWLAWHELWVWAPLPLAIVLVAYELVFWWRGDRPITLELGEVIRVTDRLGGPPVEIDPSTIEAATLHLRPASTNQPGARSNREEAVVVLATRERVVFAARFLVEPGLTTRRNDVQADAMDAILGGYGGVLRAVASREIALRQTIDDPAGQAVQWLRQHLPVEAWDRTALRVWRGAEPILDTFGLHIEHPTGLLILDGDHYTLREADKETRGTITLIRSARSQREVGLARAPRYDDPHAADEIPIERVELPLLLLELDEGTTIAVPAPIAGTRGQERALHPDLLHTHVPEGAAVLWHIITRWPEPSWPQSLRKAVTDALPEHARPLPTTRTRGRTSRSTPRNT